MKQIATVVIVNGKPMAEIRRPDACEICNACKYGREERMLVEIPPDGCEYQKGDLVELVLPTGRIAAASVVAYGIPLVCMLLGLYLGYGAFNTDLGAALCAGGALVVAMACVKLIEKGLQLNALFRPECCPDSRERQNPDDD